MKEHISTCVKMGLPSCDFCYSREVYGITSECWVDFYCGVISIPYIKLIVRRRHKEEYKALNKYDIYFMAALRQRPEELAVYEKLMLLI
jgi:hypothetical protein